MNILFPFFISSIAGLSTVLGAFVILFKWQRENINKFIVFSLAFSLTIMIGISVSELIPEASYSILTQFHLVKGIIFSLIAFIMGVIIIYFINQKITQKQDDLYRVGILSMLALMLHNLPEGIVTFLSSYQNLELGLKLSFAIMMHNIPEGISIAVPIYYSTGSKKKAFKMTFLSGLAEPLGALLAFLFLSKFITDAMIGFILLFVAGLMITLSIHDLFPKAKKYHEDNWIYIGMGVGILILLFNEFIL